MTADEARLAGLVEAKLRAIVGRLTGEPGDAIDTVVSLREGAGAIVGARAVAYFPAGARSPLGAALAWVGGLPVDTLDLVVDGDAAPVARAARGCAPAPVVWTTRGADLVPVESPGAGTARDAPAEALALAPTIEAAGAEVVVEHGVVFAEIAGLEVARAVIGADGTAELRVGVGIYDQEAHAVLHAGRAGTERLRSVVDQVLAHRRAGAPPHPLNRLARSRWLLAMLSAAPELVGLASISTPLPPLEPRQGLHVARPAAAAGRTPSGAPALVVCGNGIDLELVPTTAELLGRDITPPPAEALLVLAEGDAHPAIERMARWLAVPARVHTVAPPWR